MLTGARATTEQNLSPLATISCLETLSERVGLMSSAPHYHDSFVVGLVTVCSAPELTGAWKTVLQHSFPLPAFTFLSFPLQLVAQTLGAGEVTYTSHLLRFFMVELEFEISAVGFQLHHSCSSLK